MVMLYPQTTNVDIVKEKSFSKTCISKQRYSQPGVGPEFVLDRRIDSTARGAGQTCDI